MRVEEEEEKEKGRRRRRKPKVKSWYKRGLRRQRLGGGEKGEEEEAEQ